MDKKLHHTLYDGCNNSSIIGLKLTHALEVIASGVLVNMDPCTHETMNWTNIEDLSHTIWVTYNINCTAASNNYQSHLQVSFTSYHVRLGMCMNRKTKCSLIKYDLFKVRMLTHRTNVNSDAYFNRNFTISKRYVSSEMMNSRCLLVQLNSIDIRDSSSAKALKV